MLMSHSMKKSTRIVEAPDMKILNVIEDIELVTAIAEYRAFVITTYRYRAP